MPVEALNVHNSLIKLDQQKLDNLSKSLRGRLLTPDHPDYDAARKIWNAMIDRRPAFIVECFGFSDVLEAVKFAKQERLIISVRGGGHNIAGRSLIDKVMLIDLSKMRSVHVDPETSTATVEPGATLSDVDRETQVFSLAVPVGINSTTGIAGLTLGGGFGWLSRKYGMTIDNLLSVELLTVNGERIVCDKNRHADLFWGICGGGGNFGIITSFKFKLSPVGQEVMSGPVIFRIEEAKSVLQHYREFCKKSPEELSVWAVLRKAPPFPFLDPAYHGKPVLILAGIYCGALEEGKKALSQVKKLGNPIGDGIAPHRYIDFQSAFDPLLKPGLRNYWKSHNFKDISDGFIDAAIEYVGKLPSPHTEIFLGQLGGATNRIARDATAYPHRDIEFVMNVHVRWETADQDAACITWGRDFYKATTPFAAKGVYMNFVSQGDENLEEAFADNIKKLKSIKSKYDPDNVLRSNINITAG